MCFDDENESVVSAQNDEQSTPSSLIHGVELSADKQIALEDAISVKVAIPMGLGPQDAEVRERLIRMAENLERYKDEGKFNWEEERNQGIFEVAVRCQASL